MPLAAAIVLSASVALWPPILPLPLAPPTPFADRSTVSVDELVEALAEQLGDVAASEDVRTDFDRLAQAHGLPTNDEFYLDYVRVKTAFEATRDGGLWGLRWDITNRSPRSDEIWNQWQDTSAAEHAMGTATAECDELSALFAFVARRLGVKRIGLFWPVWNHVVAVWTVEGRDGNDVRIVVPTSQIMLAADASLGTDGFNPWKQKTIYEYRRKDVRGSFEIPAGLARFFVEQIREHGAKSQAELQKRRNGRGTS